MKQNGFHPILCALPPHVLRNILENGTPEQRQKALRTLQISDQFRGQRQALAHIEGIALATNVGKQRIVYDAQHGSNLPGQIVRQEGDPPTGDPAVNEAYDGAGDTYDLYKDIYGRDSIDNKGLRLDSSVHYQTGYDNAFWNGLQMVYGDGDEDLPPDQRLFNRFTIAIDVIGHELTHGVTQYEAGLVYYDQPGALNESISDVFGTLVKQRHLSQSVTQADWIIGQGLFTSNVNGVGIRSMKAPGTAYDDPVLGKDPQPAHMKDYQHVPYDNGGVHINSGIPNHAFYLAAIEIGGFAWEKTGQIWYIALRDRLKFSSNFAEAAQVTTTVAGELYGSGSLEQQAVRKGWEGVGVSLDGGGGCLAAILGLFKRPA